MPDPSVSSSPGGKSGSSASGVGDQARQFAGDVKQGAQSFAEDGKTRGAERLKGVADTVDRVADQVADESPMMADWVRKAANELDGVSRSLKDKSIGDLLTMGKDFARREPAAFIAASAVAGFALSRLLKSTTPSPTAGAGAAPEPTHAVAVPLNEPRSVAATTPRPGDIAHPTASGGGVAGTTTSASSGAVGGSPLRGASQPDDSRPSGRPSNEGAHSI